MDQWPDPYRGWRHVHAVALWLTANHEWAFLLGLMGGLGGPAGAVQVGCGGGHAIDDGVPCLDRPLLYALADLCEARTDPVGAGLDLGCNATPNGLVGRRLGQRPSGQNQTSGYREYKNAHRTFHRYAFPRKWATITQNFAVSQAAASLWLSPDRECRGCQNVSLLTANGHVDASTEGK
jgi:hypothetical protein